MANQEQYDILKQGVETWNQWRKEHADIQPDLHEANLMGAYLLGANLTKANLRYAFLRGALLFRANLSEADLYGVDLSEANLGEANLCHAKEVTQEQLQSALPLKGTTMPNCTKHP